REARRILDPRHPTKLPTLADTLARLGKRLVISVEDSSSTLRGPLRRKRTSATEARLSRRGNDLHSCVSIAGPGGKPAGPLPVSARLKGGLPRSAGRAWSTAARSQARGTP